MAVKWNYELAKEFLLSKGYILINTEYKNAHQKLTFYNFDGYYHYQELMTIIKGSQPRKFHPSNPYTIQNIVLWCKLNNKQFKLIDGQKYVGAFNKLQWKCMKDNCGEIFESNWSDIQSGYGCGFCCGLQVGLSNCLATKNLELSKEWHTTKNGDLTPWNISYGSKKKAWWKCKECNYEWEAVIYSRSRVNGCGCPKCNESKGEKQLDLILTKYNVPHDTQYIFDDLIGLGGGLLKFDTPIFWDNEKTQLRMLIEYDGEQHFKWIKGMMTKKQFKILQIHDEMKNQYCKQNNIKLLRIPYWDFDNMESILTNELY